MAEGAEALDDFDSAPFEVGDTLPLRREKPI